MFGDMTWKDAALAGTLIVSLPLIVIYTPSLVFTKFIALKSPPKVRAAWTVGSALAVILAGLLFGGIEGIPPWGLLLLIPAGLIVYWYWRWEFTKAWIDDPEQLRDGLQLANDDWLYGLSVVISVAIAAAIKVWLLH